MLTEAGRTLSQKGGVLGGIVNMHYERLGGKGGTPWGMSFQMDLSSGGILGGRIRGSWREKTLLGKILQRGQYGEKS